MILLKEWKPIDFVMKQLNTNPNQIWDNWDDDNPGRYFRNNVWFWRPLWQFVCASCDNVLTEKDMDRGSFNDGHKISKTKMTKYFGLFLIVIGTKFLYEYFKL